MTYQEFALLAANKTMRVAWDALMAEHAELEEAYAELEEAYAELKHRTHRRA